MHQHYTILTSYARLITAQFLISERYERSSVIITSNKSFGDWGDLFGDPVLATAILDRLLHHATVINIKGNSYRLKDRAKQGMAITPQVSEAIRSGEVATEKLVL